MQPLLIFEGAELTGKSFIISQIYDYLEQRNSTSKHILNGCHWFNCDVGVFGETYGPACVDAYLAMALAMPDRAVIFEKFHLTDAVYRLLYTQKQTDYRTVEQKLITRNARIIFCTIEENESLFAHRLADRLKLYPHYQCIAQTPSFYIRQQQTYRSLTVASALPVLTVDLTKLPNPDAVKKIINWIQLEP